MTTWIVACDGCAVPNPGRISVGVWLVAPDGRETTLARLTDVTGCCNEAEALALIAALDKAQELGAEELDIQCDSDVVVKHVGRGESSRVHRLERRYAQARALLASFRAVKLRWVPRHKNQRADALARAAAGQHRSSC